MYLGKSYISCLKSFLDGWLMGSEGQVLDVDILNDFQSWTESRYKLPNTQAWDRIILFYSTDECDALTNFFNLFEKYCEEKNCVRVSD